MNKLGTHSVEGEIIVARRLLFVWVILIYFVHQSVSSATNVLGDSFFFFYSQKVATVNFIFACQVFIRKTSIADLFGTMNGTRVEGYTAESKISAFCCISRCSDLGIST